MLPFPLADYPHDFAAHTIDAHLPSLLMAMTQRMASAQRFILEGVRVRALESALRGVRQVDVVLTPRLSDIERRLENCPPLEDDFTKWLASSRRSWDWGIACLRGYYGEHHGYPEMFGLHLEHRHVIHTLLVDGLQPELLRPATLPPIPHIDDVEEARRWYFSEYGAFELGCWKRKRSPDWWWQLQQSSFASPRRPGRITP